MIQHIDPPVDTVDETGGASLPAAVSAIRAVSELVPGSDVEMRAAGLDTGAFLEGLANAVTLLDAARRYDVLPLVHELDLTARWLSANGAVRDARSAISSAMEGLLAQLLNKNERAWHARQLAAVVNLRSVRRGTLITLAVASTSTGVTTLTSTDSAPRVLPALRKALLDLLAGRFESGSSALVDACETLAADSLDDAQSRFWQQVASIYRSSAGAMVQIALIRLAARIESLLRGPPVEHRDPHCRALETLLTDLNFLQALISNLTDAVDVDGPVTANTAFRIGDGDCLSRTASALRQGASVEDSLHALLDSLLLEGRYQLWNEIRGLEHNGMSREVMLAQLAKCGTPMSTGERPPLPGPVHEHFLHAEAVLHRLESETSGAGSTEDSTAELFSEAGSMASPPARSAIPVDEALLENLNLAAAEIRGARSRAEANLGSLRGGLQDMERTIKALRAQLEALEVDSTAAPVAGDALNSPPEQGMPARLGALSRGIDDLQGLQDALHALTEETETVLASQATEDSELEHGLLQTRLVPVGTQFQRWRDAVEGVIPAGLSIDGDQILLERRQAGALSDALIPLLCAFAVESDTAQLSIGISRPRFDLLLQIHAEGARFDTAAWPILAAEFERLGGFASQLHDGHGQSFRIVLPGPPQSVEVLFININGQRFALPVSGVAGVLRRTHAAAISDDTNADAETHSLAALLGLPEQSSTPASVPTHQVLLTGDSQKRMACRVDAVFERERMLVRSPGPMLANNPWIWAVIVTEQALPTLVLDVQAIVSALLDSAAAPA